MSVRDMLMEHMRKHIDVASDVAVYVMRYPVKGLVVKIYADKPKMTLYCQHLDSNEVLFTIELREHPLDPKAINTYFGGPLEDFVKYIEM